MVWQFNDVWPALSWSVVDYDARPKAAYYFLQRAYRPVIATFQVDGDVLELWVTNSGPTAADLELIVEVGPFGAGPASADVVPVHATAGSSQLVWRTAAPAAGWLAWVRDAFDRIPANRKFFGPLRELPLNGRVEVIATRTGAASAIVNLLSSGYSYLTRVMAPAPGIRYDTNYFDPRHDESQVVTVTGLTEDAGLSSLTVATYGSAACPVTVVT